MKKIRKILVPVDFSEASANGLKYAASLAKGTKAELTVLHVFDKEERGSFVDSLSAMEGWPVPPRVSSPMPVDAWLREKSLDLYNFVQRVAGNSDRVTVKRRIEMGKPVKEIIRVAKDERADLLVLVLKNRSLFSYLVAGSTLIKLTLRSPCPVLLTPLGSENHSKLKGSLSWARLQESHPP